MKTKNVLWTGLLLAILVTAPIVFAVFYFGSGSNVVSSIHFVDAEGKTRQLAIPNEGMTLGQLAIQAGYSNAQQATAQDENEETWLVALSRSRRDDSVTLYVPLEFVLNGAGSAVRLSRDDHLRLVNLADTDLGVLTTTYTGLEFSVVGMIEKPGSYKTVETSEVFMNVASPEYAGTYEVGAEGPDVLIVSRESSGSHREHYVIPLREPFGDIFLFESRLKANDKLTYGRLHEFNFMD